MTLGLSRDNFDPGNRHIDDFADEIITRPSGGGRAVLDAGFFTWVSDPDFAPWGYGTDFAESSKGCASAIRRNANGEDMGAPYCCLEGYDLHYRLMPHWDRKERFQALGIDPNQVISEVRARDEKWSDWSFSMNWSEKVQAVGHMEFFYRLVVATQEQRIAKGVAPDAAIDEALDEIKAEARRLPMNDTIAIRLRERLTEALQPAAPAMEM